MKTVYMANDGSIHETQGEAIVRDSQVQDEGQIKELGNQLLILMKKSDKDYESTDLFYQLERMCEIADFDLQKYYSSECW